MRTHHANCAEPLGYSCTCEGNEGLDREVADQTCTTCNGERVVRTGVEYDSSTGQWVYDDVLPCPAHPCPVCRGACELPTSDEPDRETGAYPMTPCHRCGGDGTTDLQESA